MIVTTATRRTKCSCYTLLTLTILCTMIDLVKCGNSLLDENSAKRLKSKEHGIFQVDNIKLRCESVYQEYLKAVENFTHCEIHHVRPFRLCLMCREQFQEADDLYSNLTSDPEHEPCKQKYMMSDRVQIIPTVQTNVEKMWRTSHCHRCYSRNYHLRERVSIFLDLYSNFSTCVNATIEGNARNSSDTCIQCKSQYSSLNAHFSALYDADVGDICMDIMDMMNYTRIMWSSKFNCTAGSYDSTPVVIISCFVACTPILFYVYVRITGKVRRAKLFKPKRLAPSTETSSGSHSTAGSPDSSG